MGNSHCVTEDQRAAQAVCAQQSNLFRALIRLPRGAVAVVDDTGYAIDAHNTLIAIDLEMAGCGDQNHERCRESYAHAEQIELWLATQPSKRAFLQY